MKNTMEMRNELSENELDMVNGGSAWDWIKDTAVTVGKTAALVLPVANGALGLGLITLGVATGLIKEETIDKIYKLDF